MTVMNRQQRRALQGATAQTQAAGGDPSVAAELDELRRVRQGSYALIQVLVSRLGGGPIHITRAEHQALPPKEALKIKVDPDTADVTLFVEKD